MSIQTLTALKTEWKPTVFHLSNGHSYHVNHPDYLFIGPNKKVVIIFNEPSGELQAIIDVEQIVSIERKA